MKIERTGSVRSPGAAKKAGKTTGARQGEFAKHVGSGTEGAGGVSGVAPTGAAEALLAIQEVGDATTEQPRAKAVQWGEEVLDRLERLRIAIIMGLVSRRELEQIAGLVERQRVQTDDPRLTVVLDEIELRAKVELAKLQRQG